MYYYLGQSYVFFLAFMFALWKWGLFPSLVYEGTQYSSGLFLSESFYFLQVGSTRPLTTSDRESTRSGISCGKHSLTSRMRKKLAGSHPVPKAFASDEEEREQSLIPPLPLSPSLNLPPTALLSTFHKSLLKFQNRRRFPSHISSFIRYQIFWLGNYYFFHL